MKKSSVVKLVACGSVLLAAVFVLLFFSSHSGQNTSFAESVALSVSAPSEPMPPIPVPEIYVREDEISGTPLVLSDGSSQEDHEHVYRRVSFRNSTCSEKGEQIYLCSCGRELKIESDVLPHTPSETTCSEPVVCLICGEVLSPPPGHDFPSGSDTCSRCGFTLTKSFYVLGQELEFDESAASVRQKLGTPTETVREGDLVTLVYASDLRRLTFVQVDDGGVWGVYSFDPAQRMRPGNASFGLSGFNGQQISDLGEELTDFGDFTAFCFRDKGVAYALWMRLNEYEYNFATDPAIYQNFAGQEKLSWYIVNAQRLRSGKRFLTRSSAADAVARDYCDHIIAKLKETGDVAVAFVHDFSFEWRLHDYGVNWSYAGENLSMGYTNCLFVCDAYLNSPEHRENLLNPYYTHVGVSYRKMDGTVFGAQEFYCL